MQPLPSKPAAMTTPHPDAAADAGDQPVGAGQVGEEVGQGEANGHQDRPQEIDRRRADRVVLAAHGGGNVVEVVADLFVVRHGGVPSRWVCEGRVL